MSDPAISRDDYEQLVSRVRALIRQAVPVRAPALVVSNGDARLVELSEHRLGHFPQTATGLYAGHHPADGGSALADLLSLRASGARFLVIPAPYRWWLDHYGELAQWLHSDGAVVADVADTATVFGLVREQVRDRAGSGSRTAPQVTALIDALLPPEAGVAVVAVSPAEIAVQPRRRWDIGLVDEAGSPTVAGALRAIGNAAREGASYVALALSDDPVQAPDARLRTALETQGRLVCAQRLVELYELAGGGPR